MISSNRRKGRIEGVEKYIAFRLRLMRSQKRLTRKVLAKVINVTDQQFRKYENGVDRISIGKLLMLSKVLGVDLSYFYRGYEGL